MIRPLLWLTPALAAIAACTQVTMPEAPEGQAFFVANCASCHGRDGKGNGPIVGDLPNPPADLTVLTRDNGGTFPRADALSYIYGTPGQNHLARVMPQFGEQMANDLVPLEVDGVVTPTPRTLVALLRYLEQIQE